MDYFELLGLKESFEMDTKVLRSAFLQNSKKFHPDSNIHLPKDEQEKILLLSSMNNKAYQTLSDFESRMEYILQKNGCLADAEKTVLPQEFLIEMMELNEEAMEYQEDTEHRLKLLQHTNNLEQEWIEELQPFFIAFENQNDRKEALEKIKIFYLKRKYLLRLRNLLLTFASA